MTRRLARRSFEDVNRHDFAAVLRSFSPKIHHRFGGRHAAGGERHDREAVGRWFERLGRLIPDLQLTVRDVWATGGPWNTWVFVRWDAAATLADGGAYANHGVHVINLRWGKVVSMDANEDSQAVVEGLARQRASGIEEAGAAPIVS